METYLDEIAQGKKGYIPFLEEFWRGGEDQTGLEELLENYLDVNKACTIPITTGENGITLNIGHYGPYLSQADKTKSVPFNLPMGDLTPEVAQELLDATDDAPLGNHPETGEPIYLKSGRYGPYIQLGDTDVRKSIPKDVNPEAVDLELAIKLLSLPREVGRHPETGEVILADYGRYGPYLRCGNQNARIRPPQTPLDIPLEEALNLLSRRKKSSVVLREVGSHPESKALLVIKDGPYGPYVSDGSVNASLPKNENPETISLERCVELINQKKAAPPRKRRKGKRK